MSRHRTRAELAASWEPLQRIAEFDHVFTVRPDRTLVDGPAGVYAPDVFNVDGPGDIEIHGTGWEALTGYTGQHGYSGAVMHASEYLGGRLAEDILSTPGVYVVVVVECHPEPAWPHPEHAAPGEPCPECGADDLAGNCSSHPDYPDTAGMSYGEVADLAGELEPDPEPAGWAVLRLTGGPGNGDDGTACPAWHVESGTRCGGLMTPRGPRELASPEGWGLPAGTPGELWQCVACGYAVTVVPGQ